jgi:polar amino acid transport system substrate-binding protein
MIVLVLAVAWVGGCDLPRDPKGTLDRVRGGTLRVGLVENSPWVLRAGESPAGLEPELVRRLAGELGATPEWIWGGEQEHMEAVERNELDLVVGGLTDETPWKDRVGLTGAYFEEKVSVGIPNAEPAASVEGRRVRVRAGDPAAAYLRKQGAIPVPMTDLAVGEGPIAAAEWHLEMLDLKPSHIILRTRKHVMAVPPGENAWIRRLETYFDGQRGGVKQLLQREAARR